MWLVIINDPSAYIVRRSKNGKWKIVSKLFLFRDTFLHVRKNKQKKKKKKEKKRKKKKRGEGKFIET